MPNWLKLLDTIKPYIEAGGEIAGAVGAGRAAGRRQENLETGVYDRGTLDRYEAEEQAKREALRLQELAVQDRADRFLTAGRTRAGQAAFGDALANLQDVSISGVPSYIPQINFGGGLRPSAFGPGARAAGRTLSRDALEAMLSGSDVPDLPDTSGLGGAAPAQTPLAEANALDKILEIGSYAGAGAGAMREIQEAREKRRRDQARAVPGVQYGQPVAAAIPEPSLPGYTPGAPLSGTSVANLPLRNQRSTIQLLAELKAAEDAAKAQRGK